MAPFVIESARLFEVDSRGRVQAEDPAALARRRRRVQRAWIGAVAVNAVTMPAGALAFGLGRPAISAAFGLVAMAALPLLAAPLVVGALGRRARRGARVAPTTFSDSGR
jgi:hypothetical protein